MSEYTEKAEQFLTSNGLRFRATRTEANACPLWDDPKHLHLHGNEYQITISRPGQSGRLTFRFWNSLKDKQKGTAPDAYSVLSCISSEAHAPGTFAEFCDEYGYDQDSRKAEKTFKACDKLARRIRAFFCPEELEALQEIQ